jgi:hypothetical protein
MHNSNENMTTMKHNGSKHHKKSSNDDDALVPKCFCVLHNKDNHWSNDYTVMKEQVARMCTAWSNQSPAEHSCKKCENKQHQEYDKKELHAMIQKQVQKYVAEAFQLQLPTWQ